MMQTTAQQAIVYILLFLLSLTTHAALTSPDTPQSSRLRIINQCPTTLWIQQDYKHQTNDPVVVKIPSGQAYDYAIPEPGLASTRFWPKSGCNAYGYDCQLGESVGVPAAEAQGIQKGPYAPDINSKFEATWGCLPAIFNNDSTLCAVNPSAPSQRLNAQTWWNGSAVDGYTLPYAIRVANHNNTCMDMHSGQVLNNPNVDCSQLSVSSCPKDANLSTEGLYNIIHGVNVTSVNLQWLDAKTNTLLGCFSPCSKLTMAQGSDNGQTTGGWQRILGGLVPSSNEAKMYCCPTPPVSPEACSAGPVARSSYAQSVHESQKCDAYTYAYDDAKGLAQCGAQSQFAVVFCPSSQPTPTPSPTPSPVPPPTPPSIQLQFNMNTSVGITAYLNNTLLINATPVNAANFPTNSILKATQENKAATCNLTLGPTSLQRGVGELCNRLNIVSEGAKIHVYLPADIPNMGPNSPPSLPKHKYVQFGMDQSIHATFNNIPVSNNSKLLLNDLTNGMNIVIMAYQSKKTASCSLHLADNILSIIPNSGYLCSHGLVLMTKPDGDYFLGLPNPLPIQPPTKLYKLGIAQGMTITIKSKLPNQVITWTATNKTVNLPMGLSHFFIQGKNKEIRDCPITLNSILTWPKIKACQGVVLNNDVLYFPSF
jgi:hypothetical protein